MVGVEFLIKKMTIKFTDAAEYFNGELHQIDAFKYLQENTAPEIVAEFEKRYRNKKKIINLSNIPTQALDIIKEFEGFSPTAYYDPHTNGIPITIGWGSTRRKDGSNFIITNTVTEQEADELLIYQLENEFFPVLEKIPYWSKMNDEMKSTLLSFSYNLGANFYGASGFNTISKNLRERDWKAIPKTLELYRNPGSKVESGLLRRRRSEGKLWTKGLVKLDK